MLMVSEANIERNLDRKVVCTLLHEADLVFGRTIASQ